jgi:hypothetical protein
MTKAPAMGEWFSSRRDSTIVARRFIAGLAIHKVRVPEGRLNLVLGCYESGVPDRFEVKFPPHAPNSGVPPGRRPCGRGPRR